MTAEQLEELLGKVTQGEWRVEQDTTLIWGDCLTDDVSDYGMGYPIADCRIAPVSSWAAGPEYDEAEANARLIAMAPTSPARSSRRRRWWRRQRGFVLRVVQRGPLESLCIRLWLCLMQPMSLMSVMPHGSPRNEPGD